MRIKCGSRSETLLISQIFVLNSRWWGEHSNSCGGTFTKVKEPEGFGDKKKKKGALNNNTKIAAPKAVRGQPDIRSLLTSPDTDRFRAGGNAEVGRKIPPKSSTSISATKSGGNIYGFGGTSYGSPGGGGGGLKTAGKKTGTIVVKPGSSWQPQDNSSPGTVVTVPPPSGKFMVA